MPKPPEAPTADVDQDSPDHELEKIPDDLLAKRDNIRKLLRSRDLGNVTLGDELLSVLPDDVDLGPLTLNVSLRHIKKRARSLFQRVTALKIVHVVGDDDLEILLEFQHLSKLIFLLGIRISALHTLSHDDRFAPFLSSITDLDLGLDNVRYDVLHLPSIPRLPAIQRLCLVRMRFAQLHATAQEFRRKFARPLGALDPSPLEGLWLKDCRFEPGEKSRLWTELDSELQAIFLREFSEAFPEAVFMVGKRRYPEKLPRQGPLGPDDYHEFFLLKDAQAAFKLEWKES